jgi:hypothetical protein
MPDGSSSFELIAGDDEWVSAPDAEPVGVAARADAWVTILRRTRDPKLSWVEAELRRLGVETRRITETYPPILQVPAQSADTAIDFLTAPLNGTDLTLDDLDDDSSAFG